MIRLARNEPERVWETTPSFRSTWLYPRHVLPDRSILGCRLGFFTTGRKLRLFQGIVVKVAPSNWYFFMDEPTFRAMYPLYRYGPYGPVLGTLAHETADAFRAEFPDHPASRWLYKSNSAEWVFRQARFALDDVAPLGYSDTLVASLQFDQVRIGSESARMAGIKRIQVLVPEGFKEENKNKRKGG